MTGKRRFELTISEDIIEEIKIISFRQHANPSDIVEAILRQYLEAHPNPDAATQPAPQPSPAQQPQQDTSPHLPGED